MRQQSDDFYKLLRIDRHATLPEIRTAYEAKMRDTRNAPRSADNEALLVRLDLALSVLSDPMARGQYALSQSRTGPPARARDTRPGEIETAPPIRSRGTAPVNAQGAQYSAPGEGGSRLEILGNPERRLTISSGPVRARITIRNGGDRAMTGRISSDQFWLQVSPHQIDVNATTQDIQVIVNPSHVPPGVAKARVSVVTDRGEKGVIIFEIKRGLPAWVFGVGAIAIAIAAGAAFMTLSPKKYDLDLVIDPWAEEVVFDGQSLGPGTAFHLHDLVGPTAVLEVKHPNFKTYRQEMTSEELQSGQHSVELELNREMDFKPNDEHHRTSVNQREASSVVGDLRPAFDSCLSANGEPKSVLTGSIRIYITQDGLAAGLTIEGSRSDDANVQTCVKRQAAAAKFDSLVDGDYASVRYDYDVTVPTKPNE